MRKNRFFTHHLLLTMAVVISIGLAHTACGSSSNSNVKADTHQVSATIDEMLSQIFKDDEPGAAAVAVKGGEVIFRKAYGMADMELGVPLEPDMVFRIGSMTKQFTSMAIMILAERNQLSLDDDIRKFLPDYPTHGHTLTIDHLLTHSSGIVSYTNLPEWQELSKKDLEVSEVINIFKNKELEFPPGDRLHYTNSGYFLLGAIIEKVSSLSYAEFIQKNIFEPLNMSNSYYGFHSKIIPKRVKGYVQEDGEFKNAEYFSITSPFSAGALLSSVDDLVKWEASLHTEQLISSDRMKLLFTPFIPNVIGPPIVGRGWEVLKFKERKMHAHGGGIDGFLCYGLRLPEERIYVAVLCNNMSTDYRPEYLAKQIAAILIGEPFPERKSIQLSKDQLKKVLGTYKFGEDIIRNILIEDGKIYSQREGGGKIELVPASEDTFFILGMFVHITFEFDENGESTAAVYHYEETEQQEKGLKVKK